MDTFDESKSINVLVVEPEKTPYMASIGSDLKAMQDAVGGSIEPVYPFDEPVALVCNEDGKILGMKLNRALRDENGEIYALCRLPHRMAGDSQGVSRIDHLRIVFLDG